MDFQTPLTLAQAKVDVASGALAKAALAIKSLLKANPKDVEVREALAEIVASQGRRDLEVGILAEILQDYPDRWATADSLVRSLQAEGRDAEAREFITGFLLANPDNQEAFNRCIALGVDSASLFAS
jgi:predicted Zn-dependent protease